MKRAFTIFVLAVFLIGGLFAVSDMAGLPRTYDGSQVDVAALREDPDSYEQYVVEPDGVASVIVAEDLARTHAVNAVTAVVFDFRGYDTMGEAFILVTAISGAMVILRRKAKGAKSDDGQ
ncbi:MAG: hypothetical protein IK116_01315 [Firmicutes bacterium]|nr:hypothetical protein [Bacillota bacterium]